MAGSDPHILLIGGDGGYSGVPTYLAQICRALKGHARISLAADHNQGGYDFAVDQGLTLHEIPGLVTGLNPRPRLRALGTLEQVIAADPPHLIWAHARMAVQVTRALAILHRISGRRLPPVALTLHGLPFGPGHRWGVSGLSAGVERAALALMPAHHLFFISEGSEARFAARMGAAALARHRIHVLQNCSDLGPLPARPVPAHPTVIMTGRASHQKNHAAAARILARMPPETQVILCGGGTDSPAMRALFARALGPSAEARVRFVGPVGDLRPWLARADLFLLTSRYEGLPIAALEAFEAGLPLALPAISGTAEIRDAHPMAAEIDLSSPAIAAARCTDLIRTFRKNRISHRATIHAAWEKGFSYPIWAAALRQTLSDMRASGGFAA